MSHELAPFNPATMALMRVALSGGTLPAPYAREIRLLECHIAGTQYAGLEEFAWELETGEMLTLKREPDNPHDGNAIRIQDRHERKLGYVPKAKNEVLAALMDAGKFLSARIHTLETDNWMNIRVVVVMHEV